MKDYEIKKYTHFFIKSALNFVIYSLYKTSLPRSTC